MSVAIFVVSHSAILPAAETNPLCRPGYYLSLSRSKRDPATIFNRFSRSCGMIRSAKRCRFVPARTGSPSQHDGTCRGSADDRCRDDFSQCSSAVPRTGCDARLAIRAGELTGQTAGLAPGYVQGNLAILPATLAGDFLRFCQLNPKPCPLLAASAPGDFRLPTLGRGPRHPHRPAALPRVPPRRGDRRARRHPRPLARRPRRLRAGLLVLVRGGADRGRHRAAPHDLRATVPMYRTSIATDARPARSTARWWSRCGR